MFASHCLGYNGEQGIQSARVRGLIPCLAQLVEQGIQSARVRGLSPPHPENVCTIVSETIVHTNDSVGYRIRNVH